MLKGSHSKGSQGNGSDSRDSNTGSGLLSNLKRFAGSSGSQSGSQRIETSDISSPRKVSVPSRVSNANDLRPLNKKSTMNTQNLSHYMNGKSSAESLSSNHSRSPSVQSSTKYTYSRRSSSHLSTPGINSTLTREPTNQSLSSSSVLSQDSFSNLAIFMTPDGKIKLDMPSSHEVENLFEDMMYKRNILQNLSPDKQKELMDYDVDKKWLIVKQDLQNDFKKLLAKGVPAAHAAISSSNSGSLPSSLKVSSPRSSMTYESIQQAIKFNKTNNGSSSGPASNNKSKLQQLSDKNSSTSTLTTEKINRPPIHYVKRIIADKLTGNEMNDLWVTLRTEQLDWVDGFLEHQGHIAMANVLTTSIYKTDPETPLSYDLLEKEHAFFRCFRVLSVLTQGLYELSRHNIMAETVANGLFSVRLATRKMATEIFVCMLEKKNKVRFEAVLNALDKKFKIGENLHMLHYMKNSPQHFSHFTRDSQFKIVQSWLFAVEQSLEGRGKMGSLVGASEDFKASGGENAILEYSQWTMVFINHFCNGTDVINQRILLRTRLENAGGLRIMNQFKLLDYDKVMELVEAYENLKLDDLNSVLETGAHASDIDMNDSASLLKKLFDYCKGTESEKLLNSLVKHLFLSTSRLMEDNQDPTKLSKQLRLMDSLVTNVSVSAVDESSSINMAIQRLYDSMQTDEVARRAILESRTLTKKLEEAQAERDFLSQKLSKTGNGLVGQLEKEVQQRDDILEKNQRVTLQLQDELEELKKKHLLEKHEHEVELRKMLTILNSRPEGDLSRKGSVHSKAQPGILDPDKKSTIQQALQDGLLKTKKDLSVDSKRFGITVQPNKRLKMLRLRMEDIEQEARELEMTNFADHNKAVLQAPVKVESSNYARKENELRAKELKANKLSELRKALADIQKESNGVSKFNVEERVNELFKQKKLSALDRLNDLENMYKEYGIDLSTHFPIQDEPQESAESEKNAEGPSTLDPRAFQAKLDEIDRISKELIEMKSELKNDKALRRHESPSKQDTDDDEIQDTGSMVNEDLQSSGTSSFLESLSQKYGTGKNATNMLTNDILNSSERKGHSRQSFMERMKKPSGVPAYLEELPLKVPKAPPLGVAETEDSSDNIAEDVEKESAEHDEQEENSGKPDVASQKVPQEGGKAGTPHPVPPPMPDMLKKGPETSAAPPPPPPPPPPPMFAQAGNSGPIPPPPPPPPPSLTPSTSEAAKLSPPPPPPPLLGQKMAYRTAVPSPLLPQSPSLFSSYPRARKKLKQLHWEKLDATDNSIWSSGKAEKFAGDLYEKGVLEDLEKAFAAREIKSLATKKREDLDKITFLSRDVSQQFGINLHMYSQLSVEELVTKILKCERDFMDTPSVLEFLSKPEIIEVSTNLARNYSPYSTDWDGVSKVEDAKSPEKDPAELQRADQLYLQLIYNLQPYWGSRMRALRVITSYEREYSELVTKLRKVDKAVAVIQKSTNLRNVFNVILAVGNYMNDSAKQAQGFKLSTLQRLTFIKDANNSMTFLNYVEKIVRDNYPSFNDFLEDLQPVLDVVKISIEQLISDCKEFSQSITNVERSIDIGNLNDSSKFHPLDKVLVKVLPVLPEASKRVELLDEEVKLSIMEFESLMQRYGEDSADKFAKNSFFKKFADFINEYKRAQAQNLKAEEEERLYQTHKKMVEEQQKRAEEKERSENATEEDASEENEDRRAMMDKLLEQLKNAGPVKADPLSARKRAMIRKKMLNDSEAVSDVLDSIQQEDDSMIYSPEKQEGITNPTGDSSQSPSKGAANNQQDEEEITDRAKALLMGLRGGESPSKRNNVLNGHKEKLRARRRKTNTDMSPEGSFLFNEEVRGTISSADTDYSNEQQSNSEANTLTKSIRSTLTEENDDPE